MTKFLTRTITIGLFTIIDVVLFYAITEWWLHLDPVLAAVIVIGGSVNAVRYMVDPATKGTETK